MADIAHVPPPRSAGRPYGNNECGVFADPRGVHVLRFGLELTRAQALNLAAWLVYKADTAEEFEQWQQSVRDLLTFEEAEQERARRRR